MPHNPLHPSVVDKLDPEYVTFHNAHLIDVIPPERLPVWDPKIRERPAVPGTSQPREVGSIKDFNLSKTNIRAFTPKGDRPANGWPVFIWFHGGMLSESHSSGWTLGNIDSETSFITQMVNIANCVVVTVNYRLAPEDRYPAAVEDSIESLHWVVNQGPKEIAINPNRIAVGGSSSGGNLAATVTLKAVELKIPLIFQLLIVPVCDNTASADTLWKENENAPWLTPVRMEWFKNNYLPNKEDWTKWDASPTFAPVELLKQTPKAWIGVGEIDILKAEGVEYGEKLRKAGVDVEIVIYPGAPHPIMAMDGTSYCLSTTVFLNSLLTLFFVYLGILQVGRKMIADAGAALTRAFAESS
ncbi:hypothetical protein D9756_008499 [Leucocoprinus leucothites]|uniref:Alpha/beta hydrolase fold-3 domain-containing protein n=1 Tax=Leucocoprinus leucothites TaxID=201217 RepID=A0A8H5FVR7_9AGAR|nr:hypothetical protein D9756_008499 [Leucoagaricus leucothites]